MKWIRFGGEGGCIGFNSATEAEAFLYTQSENANWISQFEIKFNTGPDGKLVCSLETKEPVIIHL